jgi:plasmid maintenance system antidote protein VapI
MNILVDIETKFNLKSKEVAHRLSVSKSYYSMLRKGKRAISKNVALRLKEVFGVALDISLCSKVYGT